MRNRLRDAAAGLNGSWGKGSGGAGRVGARRGARSPLARAAGCAVEGMEERLLFTLGAAPVAYDDVYGTPPTVTLVVPVGDGVLANDTDADEDDLAAVLVSGPSNGTLTLNANGSFVYKPKKNYSGPDGFTYKVNDGTADSGVATVTLTVNPVNDAPVVKNLDVRRLPGKSVKVDALAKASDVEGQKLTLSIGTKAVRGTAVVNNNGTPNKLSDDYIVYTPNASSYRRDRFTYVVTDESGAKATGTAVVNVFGAGLVVNPRNPRQRDLVVVGGGADDSIILSKARNGIAVKLNGVNQGTFNPSGRIVISGMAGNDTLQAPADVRQRVRVDGGAGDDTVIGADDNHKLIEEKNGGPKGSAPAELSKLRRRA